MPSPRPSSGMRPTTPLSPSSRYDSMTSARTPSFQNRSPSSQQRRQYGHNLTLPTLPRFHPANFPSPHSSFANTPNTGPNSPKSPTNLSSQQKMYLETQRQLHAYQRETFSRSSSTQHLPIRPDSPRLQPLGSPGPVTPLELETNEGYLTTKATNRASSGAMEEHSQELVQKLVQAVGQTEQSQSRTHSASRSR